MNLHAIQNPESALELEQLCRVPLQIISPQNNMPVIGICQDSLVGAFLMTDDSVRMRPNQFMQLMMTNTNFDGTMPSPGKDGLYTGKQAISTILPRFDFEYKSDAVPVTIKDGQLLTGRFGKGQLGAKRNTLTHIIFNDYNPEETLRFLDNEQQVVNAWLLQQNGFSVGINDCILTRQQIIDKNEIIETKLNQAVDMLRKAHQNILENKFGKNPSEDFEDQVVQHLNTIREDTKITQRIDAAHNRFLAMTMSGSKGQEKNLGQIMSCLGQQVVAVKQPDRPTFKQQRIPYNYGKIKGGFDGRTLPHFYRHDDTPKARGFCKNSFLVGLDPFEFFFHNASGREGLIDTAIKSVTGDTPIVIIEGGISKRVLIGDWIDEHMTRRPDDIERLPVLEQEYLRLSVDTYIPASDNDGNVTWGKMSAITRHDPGKEMYRITTKGGRQVTVIESKSLIVWQQNIGQFREISTPDLKIGDFLPVTTRLPDPPIIMESIDLSTVFPKDRYLHSDDFMKAKRMYEEMMSGRRQAVRGWWQAHNGSDFMLPYPTIQSFARVLTRSYVDFKPGCVYPFDGNRTCGHLPASFSLNRENGIFIGMYLADGDTDREAGSVRISNNSEEIMTFMRAWFDKYGIKHREDDKPSKTMDASSHCIRGYSRMLADVLDVIASRHAHHKFVPAASLCGSKEHVIGILSGYFSTEGGVRSMRITSSSASPRLTEGIAMLCSRIGVFGRQFVIQPAAANNVTTNIAVQYSHNISGDSARRFADQVDLLKSEKNQRLKAIIPTEKKRIFRFYHDVAFDPVESIERLDVSQYTKVYDVTVPSINNFGIANGLSLKNTADTGYLQRRLIKLMEDGKVYYDGTVRNNSRLILQFDYGCDGFEAIRLESDKICQRVFKMDDDTMLKTFKLSAFEDWTKIIDAKMRTEIKKDAGLEKLLNDEFDEIYEYREVIRNEIFKHPVGKTGLSAKTCDAIDSQMPVNMSRLIDNTKHKFRIRKKLSDLNPRYIVDRVSQLMDKVTGVLPDDSEYMKANSRDNRLLHRIILRLHLSTKRVLTEYRLTRDMFDFVIYSIEDGFRRAIAQPGDMVGIIAAQSLGQPTTQMTLNTFHSAGMASQFNVVDGVPRLEELISASAKPKAPAITIYLKPEYMQDEDRAEIVRNKLRQTRLSDLARSSEIVYDPSDENTLLGQDQEFLKSYYAFMKENSCNFDSVWVLRLDLDKEKMLERNIRMWEIEQALLERFTNEIQCVFADDNAKQLTVRIRISNESGMDNPDDDQDVIFLLKQLEKSLMDSLVLRGIEGIKNALIPPREQRPYIERVAEDGGLIDDPDNREIVIVAEQSGVGDNSLLEIFKLPEVDEYRTVSNYVGDINTMLGIEAARNMLFREIHRVFSESDINHRHIEMLVDTMTCKGDLTKINRVGIHKLNVGPLARSSFEETETQFMYAAAYAQEDNFQGVSANTMLGQYYPGGTGECEVLLDEDMLMETLKDDTSTIEEEPDEEDLAIQEEAAQDEAEQITESQLGFDFSLD